MLKNKQNKLKRGLILFILPLFTLMACNKEPKEGENKMFTVTEKNSNLNLLGKAVAISLNEDVLFRELLKQEASKQFDYDYDVLFSTIMDKQVGNQTVRDLIARNFKMVAPGSDFDKSIASLRYVQLSIPVNIDKWDTRSTIPQVAIKPVDFDEETAKEVMAYNSKGEPISISTQIKPEFPVVVISEAERIDKQGRVVVNESGIVLPDSKRIAINKALELANSSSRLKSKKITSDPFISILPDDTFAFLKCRVQQEEFVQKKTQTKINEAFSLSNRKRLKNATETRMKLTGYSHQPFQISLDWDRPDGKNYSYNVYATGMFEQTEWVYPEPIWTCDDWGNCDWVWTEPYETTTFKVETRLVGEAIGTNHFSFPLPVTSVTYDIRVEGYSTDPSRPEITSNTIALNNSSRNGAGSKERISYMYFSASKIEAIEGWIGGNLEIHALSNTSNQEPNLITESGISVVIEGHWKFSWWMLRPIWVTDNTDTGEELSLQNWSRARIDIGDAENYYTNGVLSVSLREYDGDSTDGSQAVARAVTILTTSLFGTSSESAKFLENISKKVNDGDEKLGSYSVKWWDGNYQRLTPTSGVVIVHSFK